MSGNPDVAGLRSSLSTGRGDGFEVVPRGKVRPRSAPPLRCQRLGHGSAPGPTTRMNEDVRRPWPFGPARGGMAIEMVETISPPVFSALSPMG